MKFVYLREEHFLLRQELLVAMSFLRANSKKYLKLHATTGKIAIEYSLLQTCNDQ